MKTAIVMRQCGLTRERAEQRLAANGAFEDADVVILHDIYASAREARGSITGEDLFRRVADRHPQVLPGVP